VLDTGGREITLNPAGGPLTIARDGTISQGAAQLGKLGVARFANLSDLTKEGDNLFSAPAGAATQAPDALRRQGNVERSNTQPILEITRLIEITRTYERVSQLMDQAQDLQRNSIDRLGRTAA
jgi:flagellar basal-body rod protein FlgF